MTGMAISPTEAGRPAFVGYGFPFPERCAPARGGALANRLAWRLPDRPRDREARVGDDPVRLCRARSGGSAAPVKCWHRVILTASEIRD
jgi:hypothetical protein